MIFCIVAIPSNLLNAIENTISKIAAMFATFVPTMRKTSKQIRRILKSAVIKNGVFSKCNTA